MGAKLQDGEYQILGMAFEVVPDVRAYFSGPTSCDPTNVKIELTVSVPGTAGADGHVDWRAGVDEAASLLQLYKGCERMKVAVAGNRFTIRLETRKTPYRDDEAPGGKER